MPLARRLPKRGFTSNFRKEYSIVNVSDLNIFEDGAVITAVELLDSGILSKIESYGVKVLGSGTLSKKLTVKAAKFSKSAEEIIKNAGGNAEVI